MHAHTQEHMMNTQAHVHTQAHTHKGTHTSIRIWLFLGPGFMWAWVFRALSFLTLGISLSLSLALNSHFKKISLRSACLGALVEDRFALAQFIMEMKLES